MEFKKPESNGWAQQGSLLNLAKQHGASSIVINANAEGTKGVANLVKDDGSQATLPLGKKAVAKWQDLKPADLIVQHNEKGNDGKPVTVATLAGGGGNVFKVE